MEPALETENVVRDAAVRLLRALARMALIVGLMAGLMVCGVHWAIARTYDLSRIGKMASRSYVYDADGEFYSVLPGTDRVIVPLEKVSRHFQAALVAREDSRFYRHHGVDWIGLCRALAVDLLRGGFKQGASTLSMQLAKNTYFTDGRPHHGGLRALHEKLVELFLAPRIEANLSKRQVMEDYVNLVNFGSGFYGVEAASEGYFGKPCAKLTLPEAATLAGVIRSPANNSPLRHPLHARRARDEVLERMLKLKMISRAVQDAATAEPVRVRPGHGPNLRENYAATAVLMAVKKRLSEEQIQQGGWRIYSTVDAALQAQAENAIEKRLRSIERQPGYRHSTRAGYTSAMRRQGKAPEYLQGALVAMENRTGAVRALVGGRSCRDSAWNRALEATPQVGSTVKPFVYMSAYLHGLAPDSLISDGRIRKGELRFAPSWTPSNSEGSYRGLEPAQEGLIESRNTMTARIADRTGLGNIVAMLMQVGFGPRIPMRPAIVLGAVNARLIDVTAAYTIFPNDGRRVEPYLIERIDDPAGRCVFRASPESEPVADPRATKLVASELQEVVRRGTGAPARRLGLRKPAGGKTGTTEGFHDAWFVGYTSSLTCGVWVGFDKPQTVTKHGFGAELALPIWVDVIQHAPDARYPASPFQQGSNINRK